MSVTVTEALLSLPAAATVVSAHATRDMETLRHALAEFESVIRTPAGWPVAGYRYARGTAHK